MVAKKQDAKKPKPKKPNEKAKQDAKQDAKQEAKQEAKPKKQRNAKSELFFYINRQIYYYNHIYF